MNKDWRLFLSIVLLFVIVGSITGCFVIAPLPPPPPEECEKENLPEGVIYWDEAKYHIGEECTVCGHVVEAQYVTYMRGTPTFLNIGKPVSCPDSFRVVIRDECRPNFPEVPERCYFDRCVYVTGLIVADEGVPQIEICYPSQIKCY